MFGIIDMVLHERLPVMLVDGSDPTRTFRGACHLANISKCRIFSVGRFPYFIDDHSNIVLGGGS